MKALPMIGICASIWLRPIAAAEFTWNDFTVKSKATGSFGAAVRTEDADTRLLGKLNVPGQQNLSPDSCVSFSGDPAPTSAWYARLARSSARTRTTATSTTVAGASRPR